MNPSPQSTRTSQISTLPTRRIPLCTQISYRMACNCPSLCSLWLHRLQGGQDRQVAVAARDQRVGSTQTPRVAKVRTSDVPQRVQFGASLSESLRFLPVSVMVSGGVIHDATARLNRNVMRVLFCEWTLEGMYSCTWALGHKRAHRSKRDSESRKQRSHCSRMSLVQPLIESCLLSRVVLSH